MTRSITENGCSLCKMALVVLTTLPRGQEQGELVRGSASSWGSWDVADTGSGVCSWERAGEGGSLLAARGEGGGGGGEWRDSSAQLFSEASWGRARGSSTSYTQGKSC